MTFIRSLAYTADPRKFALLVLIILIPGAVLAALSGWFGRHHVLRRVLGLVALAAYMRYVLRVTVLARSVDAVASIRLSPFWSYRECLEWTGEGLRVVVPDVLEQIGLNYALYLSLGYLLAFAWPEVFCDGGAAGGAMRVGLVAATVSLATEVAQLLMRTGWVEYDDVFGNTMGAMLGYLCFRAVRAVVERRVRR